MFCVHALVKLEHFSIGRQNPCHYFYKEGVSSYTWDQLTRLHILPVCFKDSLCIRGHHKFSSACFWTQHN